MNICIVSNFKESGYGESTRPGQLAKYLHSFGHNVLHICDWEGRKEDIKHIRIERDTWEPNAVKRLFSFLNNYLTITLFKPDLVYTHQYNNARWARQTKLFEGKKIVFDAHTSKYFEHLYFSDDQALLDVIKNEENRICHSVDFIIAASEETRDFLINTYELNPAKVAAVGNATDMVPVQEIHKPGNKKFTCLTTLPQDGFKANEMALNMLLAIAAETYRVNEQVEFRVIGGGKMPEAKTPNVVYAGYVTDLRQTILNADICLMPFPENAVCGGARNKFCDYVALGKAVITTPEGLRGMEVLRDKENCLVAKNIGEFVSLISEVTADTEKIRALERNVYSLRNYFNWKDRALQVELLFNRLLEK